MKKAFLFSTIILFISIYTLFITLTRLDPFSDHKVFALSLFFVSTFCIVAAFFSFVFFFLSEIILKRKLSKKHYFRAIRRASLFGIYVILVLGLHLLGILDLLELLLIGIYLGVIEWIFITSSKKTA